MGTFHGHRVGRALCGRFQNKHIGLDQRIVYLVCVLLLSSGCRYCGPENSWWLYEWEGKTSNMSGCATFEAKRGYDAFDGSWVKVLRREEGQIVIMAHGVGTSLLISVAARDGVKAGKWSTNTDDRSARAWLVRLPQSSYRRALEHGTDGNPLEMPDIPMMLALADGRTDRGKEDGVFSLKGTVTVVASAEHIEKVAVDLVTKAVMPIDEAYFQYLKDCWAGSMSHGAVKAIRDAEECLKEPPTVPASLKGEFRGRWVCKHQGNLL